MPATYSINVGSNTESLRKPDITKAKKLLNWYPMVSIEDGLKKTLDFFYEQSTKELNNFESL